VNPWQIHENPKTYLNKKMTFQPMKRYTRHPMMPGITPVRRRSYARSNQFGEGQTGGQKRPAVYQQKRVCEILG